MTKKRAKRPRVEQLADIIIGQQREIDFLSSQLAEAHLRIRYCMDAIRHQQPSAIIGGQPTITTLYQTYVRGDRDRYMAKLEEEKAAYEQSLRTAEDRTQPTIVERVERAELAPGGTDEAIAATLDRSRSPSRLDPTGRLIGIG